MLYSIFARSRTRLRLGYGYIMEWARFECGNIRCGMDVEAVETGGCGVASSKQQTVKLRDPKQI